MNELELNSRVFERLSEFEEIDEIQFSSDWNNSFTLRLNKTKRHSRAGLPNTKFTILILFFVILNFGFILNVLNTGNHNSFDRKSELKIISNELLVNPISINN